MEGVRNTLLTIQAQVKKFNLPWVTKVSRRQDPYKVLISCLLSLRTKDSLTQEATKRLFSVAKTPQEMLLFSPKKIEKLIYPVGFYKRKARVILKISKEIISKFKGKLPSQREKLLEFKGVGEKCASLVLGLGFNYPAICVDTHVHRISNRLWWVNTKRPQETERELMKLIPKKYWIRLNSLLVAFGQNICLPISPLCSRCKVERRCKKIGIKHHR